MNPQSHQPLKLVALPVCVPGQQSRRRKFRELLYDCFSNVCKLPRSGDDRGKLRTQGLHLAISLMRADRALARPQEVSRGFRSRT